MQKREAFKMKVYICEGCRRIAYMSRKRKFTCTKCEKDMVSLPIYFVDWCNKNQKQRDNIIDEYLALPPEEKRSKPKRKSKAALQRLNQNTYLIPRKKKSSSRKELAGIEDN